jgi:poly(A) polymerase/tRNA nucleotidyltransferase (CCA-adding enzyme)
MITEGLRALLRDPAVETLLAALPSARLVGGCVRDGLLERAVHDIDLATPLPPETVAQQLEAAGLRVIPTGLSHGTVTAFINGVGYEITTLRRDVETDGRHAVVAFTDDWRDDAARRDFTINAMSLTARAELFDYFSGREDLHAGCVRFVGDPATRIAEDRLRVLRFFRFHARYARVPPSAETLHAIAAAAPALPALSAERIWSELQRILIVASPCEAVDLMHGLGVLTSVLPEGASPARLRRLVEAGAPADPILRLAALLNGDAERAAERLRLSNEQTSTLLALREAAVPEEDAAVAPWLADVPKPILLGRLWLAGASPALRARVEAYPVPRFPLEGRDVVALGVAPGPAVGAALRAVRAWWLESGAVADHAACLQRLTAFLKANSAEPDLSL